MERRVTATADLQASVPDVQLGLSRAGVTGVQKAVRMQHGGSDALVSAEIDCFVDLDPAQKGVHMSRFPELFEEAIDELVIGEMLLVERLAEHIARHIVARQDALRAEVRIAARYPIERSTPVTGLRTQELVSLLGIAAASRTASRRLVGVEATGINACPCAQGLVRDQAAERLGEAGFADVDIERILELVPLATHNQRGRGTLFLGTELRLDAEDLVDIVEQSMSSRSTSSQAPGRALRPVQEPLVGSEITSVSSRASRVPSSARTRIAAAGAASSLNSSPSTTGSA